MSLIYSYAVGFYCCIISLLNIVVMSSSEPDIIALYSSEAICLQKKETLSVFSFLL